MDTIEVRLRVTLQVSKADEDEPGVLDAVTAAGTAREAVHEALTHAMNRGFTHPEADWLCVGLVDVEDYDSQKGQ